MQSYSQDLRERVLWALDRGERPSSIAQRLEVSRVWVYQVRDRARKLGKRTSFQIGGHRRSRVAGLESVLRAWIEAEQTWRCRSCPHVWPSRMFSSNPVHCGIS